MKSKVIYIRCTPETFRRFRVFVAEKGFKNYEEALNYLLEHYERTRIVDVEVFGQK